MTIATTKTIAKLPHLATFLADQPGAVAGWGRKPSGRRAIWLSRLLRRRFALLEDGFIRSVARQGPPLSLIVDDLGVYYDARNPSRMESTISHGANERDRSRAADIAELWRNHRISKYNHAPAFSLVLPQPYVLVVDQTYGDLSIVGGLAGPKTFAAMLEAAISENPGVVVVVKVHPDVLTKATRGHFSADALRHPQVVVMADACHAPDLIEHAAAVYCVTSLMGFEALLWCRPVRCFGMPFYAGWGLTHDEQRAPPRRHRAPLEAIVHAALVSLARYADPASGSSWSVEQTIVHVGVERARLLAAQALVA